MPDKAVSLTVHGRQKGLELAFGRWREVGLVKYPHAKRLVVTAYGGGSTGSRVRLWKLELQRLANELGIDIEVHHFPPGTSK